MICGFHDFRHLRKRWRPSATKQVTTRLSSSVGAGHQIQDHCALADLWCGS
jgi:hypothetical protein